MIKTSDGPAMASIPDASGTYSACRGTTNGVERLIDPSAPFEQGREERPDPQLRDLQFQVAGGRGQHPRAMPVALRQPAARALMRTGADHRGELGLDQRLIDRLGRRPDPILDIRDLQYLQQLEQGRLIQGHRVLCPSAKTIGVGFADHHTVAPSTWSPTPSGPTTYTTRRDATPADPGPFVGKVSERSRTGTRVASLAYRRNHVIDPFCRD